MGNYVQHILSQEAGYDPGYWILTDTLLSLALCLLICGISWALLKRRYFRANIVYLIVVGVLLVLPQFFLDVPTAFLGNDVFLLICIWDHYWARNRLGKTSLSPQKARRIQVASAVILSLCWLLCLLEVGFFQELNRTSLLVTAGDLWAHAYYHRKDVDEPKDSYFL